MRYIRSALTIGSATLMVVGLAGPAEAAKRTMIDPPRDAPKSVDVTKVTYKHTKRGVSARFKVRGLTKRGEFVLAVGSVPGNKKRFAMTATRSGGKVTKRFYRSNAKGNSRKKCKGMRVRWRARHNVIWMSFPVRCYKPLNKRVGIAVGSVKKSFPNGPTIDSGPYARLKR